MKRATCALTFDDGPDPVWTPRVLDRLRAEEASSTFFVMADRAAAHPGVIDRMRTEGHEVEFHCVRHVRHSDLEPAVLRAETEQGLQTLGRLGVSATRWRPPWGVATEHTRRIARELALEVVGWSADTEDWSGAPAAEMHDRVKDLITPGSVVLLHDGLGPGARRSGCGETVALIPRLMRTIRQRALRAVPLSESAA